MKCYHLHRVPHITLDRVRSHHSTDRCASNVISAVSSCTGDGVKCAMGPARCVTKHLHEILFTGVRLRQCCLPEPHLISFTTDSGTLSLVDTREAPLTRQWFFPTPVFAHAWAHKAGVPLTGLVGGSDGSLHQVQPTDVLRK